MGRDMEREQLMLATLPNLRRLAGSLGLVTAEVPKRILVQDILRAIREGTREHERIMREKRRADAIAAFTVRDSRCAVQEVP